MNMRHEIPNSTVLGFTNSSIESLHVSDNERRKNYENCYNNLNLKDNKF